MARRKTESETVRIRLRLSFNNMYEGDEAEVELTERVQRWLDNGLAEVVGDGTDQAGPRSAEPDDHERNAAGTDGGGAAGRTAGQGFGTGTYGSPQELDQG